ncbi:cobalt ECF transporter T component CbiQ [Xanthobacter sp. ZOL 2024]
MGDLAPAAGLLDTPARRSGWIPRLDPRVRLVTAGAFAVLVVACSAFGPLLAALAGAGAMMVAAHLPIGRTLRRVATMDSFIVFMLATLPFTTPGAPLFTLFGLPASQEGVVHAATIALKANAVMLMAMALLSTLAPDTLARALARLGAPERLVHLILFKIRYVDMLHQEYHRLRTAMRARGFKPANTRHTYVSFGYLIGMMLIRALERSERILKAMKCRGFTGRLFIEDDSRLGAHDIAFCILAGALATGLVTWEVMIRVAAS